MPVTRTRAGSILDTGIERVDPCARFIPPRRSDGVWSGLVCTVVSRACRAVSFVLSPSQSGAEGGA